MMMTMFSLKVAQLILILKKKRKNSIDMILLTIFLVEIISAIVLSFLISMIRKLQESERNEVETSSISSFSLF